MRSAAFVVAATLGIAASGRAEPFEFSRILQHGYVSINLVTPLNFADAILRADERSSQIEQMCRGIEKSFKRYNWGDNPCNGVDWQANLKTSDGHPLIYASFGNGSHTTLILGGVHPDEL